MKIYLIQSPPDQLWELTLLPLALHLPIVATQVRDLSLQISLLEMNILVRGEIQS